jgi:hypothetical protein
MARAVEIADADERPSRDEGVALAVDCERQKREPDF